MNFKEEILGIILKDRVEICPSECDSFSDILEFYGGRNYEQDYPDCYVRVSLTAPWKHRKDIREWDYAKRQRNAPDWYYKDIAGYEAMFRNAVYNLKKDYFEKKFDLVPMCGRMWTPIKEDEKGTYYLLYGSLAYTTFSEEVNSWEDPCDYSTSDIRHDLLNSDLAKGLKNKFGKRIVPITTNLLSLDGFDDYGVIEGDVLAIPTFDLYRECRSKIPFRERRSKIPQMDFGFWLATTSSTPTGNGGYSMYIDRDGEIQYCTYDRYRNVRPYFILKS